MIFNSTLRKWVGGYLKFTSYIIKNYSNTPSSNLMTCIELAQIMQRPAWYDKLRILDATWDLDGKDYYSNHMQHRIPGSKFFSFDHCRDLNSKFPRMLPSPDEFSAYVSNLGVSNEHRVVVYDNHELFSIYSSPRVWWMFKVFGHNNVAILEGGFKTWLENGYPITSGEYEAAEIFPAPPKRFISNKQPHLVKKFDFMQSNTQARKRIQVVDARGNDRFVGLTNEDGSDGHIPHSLSAPFRNILNEKSRTVRSKDEIKKYFEDTGVDLNDNIISSCGSGVTACILAFAMHHATEKDVAVYDGSWSEWRVRAPNMISRGDQP